MPNTEMAKATYPLVKKIAGIKVQEDGGLTLPDEIYDVNVADFIVEIDRSFMAKLTNKDAADIIREGFEVCKDQLKESGLKIMGSHMLSNPPKDKPHITVSVVDDKRLNAIVDNINKVTNQ
jgi:hypothetical protein